jgi:hypothetical protein
LDSAKTDGERRFRWLYGSLLKDRPETQEAFRRLGKETGLSRQAQILRKALKKKTGSADIQKAQFKVLYETVQPIIPRRLAEFLKREPKPGLLLEWLHGLLVEWFNVWISEQARLRPDRPLGLPPIPQSAVRLTKSTEAMRRRCRCHLAFVFGDGDARSENKFASDHHLTRSLVRKDLKYCYACGLPRVNLPPPFAHRADLRRRPSR